MNELNLKTILASLSLYGWIGYQAKKEKDLIRLFLVFESLELYQSLFERLKEIDFEDKEKNLKKIENALNIIKASKECTGEIFNKLEVLNELREAMNFEKEAK